MAKRSPAKKPAASRSGGRAKPSAELSADLRVVVLAGKEAFLRQRYTDTLRELLEEAGHSVETVRFDGANALAADVLDECRSMGLLAGHKLVVVDEADQFVKEANRPLVTRYAQAPSESATLVLRCDSWNKGKELDKAIEAVGAFVPCDLLSVAVATKSAVKMARDDYARTLEPDAAELLVARIGPDLARIDTELAKLAAGVQPGEPITAAQVRAMVGLSKEEKAWVIQDELLNPDPEPALLKLRELIELSRVDTVPIRWACTDLARKLHAVSEEISRGVPPHAAGKSMRLWGPSAQTVRSVASKASPARLAALFRECIETDFRAKTGQGDDVRALEALVLRFASVARGSADS